jgi:hypothetical protein
MTSFLNKDIGLMSKTLFLHLNLDNRKRYGNDDPGSGTHMAHFRQRASVKGSPAEKPVRKVVNLKCLAP